MIGNGQTLSESPVFEGNPRLATRIMPEAVWVHSSVGRRPYIDYQRSDGRHQAYDYRFHVEPGELYLTDEELAWPQRGFVLIEPNVKGTYAGNKDWGFDKWQKVVDGTPGRHFVQCGEGRVLRGVTHVPTRSFRLACGLLSHADVFIGTDGGLHHAAAALGKRAVVLWGGLAPPSVLGYDTHTNLCHATTWCGSYQQCAHCRKALDLVSVDEVIAALDGHP